MYTVTPVHSYTCIQLRATSLHS